MSKVSNIKRLPPELRDLIHGLLEDGHTLDEIKGKLDELGADVSRSALGRYKKKLNQVGEKIRQSRTVAEALVKNLGDAPESKTARLNIELMHSAILNLMAADNDDEDSLNPMGAMLMAKALDHLAKAQKADSEHIIKIREQLRKAEEAKMQKALKKASQETGGGAHDIQDIFKKIQAIYRGEA